MNLFPEDDAARKLLPMFRLVTRYFPKALREVTRVSVVNNARFNPGCDPSDIKWARGKSTDQLGSAFRHMLEHDVDGKVKDGETYILAQAAWRLLAALELEIEEQELAPSTLARVGTGNIGKGVNAAIDSAAELPINYCQQLGCLKRVVKGEVLCAEHLMESI